MTDQPHTCCKAIIVTFLNDSQHEYPMHAPEGPDDQRWRWRLTTRDGVALLIVRPRGKGVPRHEIPLMNVASYMLVDRE
jgi:hypothetical protein